MWGLSNRKVTESKSKESTLLDSGTLAAGSLREEDGAAAEKARSGANTSATEFGAAKRRSDEYET